MFNRKKTVGDDALELVSFKTSIAESDPTTVGPYTKYSITFRDDLGTPIDADWIKARLEECESLDRTSGRYLDSLLISTGAACYMTLKNKVNGFGGHVWQIQYIENEEMSRIQSLAGSIDNTLVELAQRYNRLQSIERSRI